MFEHLTNSFEEYRNEVIEANKELYNLEETMRNNSSRGVVLPVGFKHETLLSFYKAQDMVNNLYRVQPTY